MRYDPEKHHRRSIRLQGYDYSQAGAYFVTICTYQRECLFGDVVGGQMALNAHGRIACEEWGRSAQMRREIQLDEFVVMPNHVHGIVIIRDEPHPIVEAYDVGATGRSPLRTARPGPPKRSLGSFIAGFKSAATQRINHLRGTPGLPVWQRNYYEHIIRNEEELNRIREYIHNNPLRWHLDRENPNRVGEDAQWFERSVLR